LKKNEKRKTKKIFYTLKKIKQKAKEKILVKFAPKRSSPQWTSNKMGNAKKSHNKTGRAKAVTP